MQKNNLLLVGLGILLFAGSFLISYGIFGGKSINKGSTSVTPIPIVEVGGQTVFDKGLPKTKECPLNGAFYSTQQKDWWEKHRPLGVMIENHKESRPQSGLSFADVVYEIVAEGGITRFLAVFYCQDAGIIGPVRSARTYFVDFISEYGNFPLYAHVGGANQPGPADALSQIDNYNWGGYNDMNQFSIGFPTFWRDYNRQGRTVATEHTMYSATQKLWDFAKDTRDLTNVDSDKTSWDENFVPYGFKDEAALAERGKSQSIHLEFWKSLPDYFVDWKYDRVSNLYKRFNATIGAAYIDKDTNKQLTAKNLVVLSMLELNANDGYVDNDHLLYKNKGTGKAQVFMDGKKIDATWRKDKRTSKTLLFDTNGSPIKFDRGLIWLSVLPTTGVAIIK